MTSVAEPTSHSGEHKRRVNDLIHESLHEHRQSEPIAFFCECPSSRCFDTVWLSASEYETGRHGSEWSVRAAGH